MKHTFQSHGLRYFILTETISSEQIRRRKKKKKERKKEGEEKKKEKRKDSPNENFSSISPLFLSFCSFQFNTENLIY